MQRWAMLARWAMAATLIIAIFVGISGARADGLNDLRGCGLAEQRKDFSAAIALCTRAMQSPDLPPNLAVDALTDRGFAYIMRGAFPLAVQDFNAALLRKPDLAPALAGRGWAESGLKQYDAALADLDQALRSAGSTISTATMCTRPIRWWRRGA
jgi:tetratricopeptide (TPR) repeat protein